MNHRKYIDKIIVNYKNGYTLVELIIVVAIMAIIALFGIPAISKYNKMSEFRQKTEEVKGLFGQVYALAKNPESVDIDRYEIWYDNGASSFVLNSVKKGSGPAVKTTVEKLKLQDGKGIAFRGTGGGYLSLSTWIFYCSTQLVDGKISCQTNNVSTGGGKILMGPPNATALFASEVFYDSDRNVSQKVFFLVHPDTFNIEVLTSPYSP